MTGRYSLYIQAWQLEQELHRRVIATIIDPRASERELRRLMALHAAARARTRRRNHLP